ncbi:hypothetical protein M408DRAFT_290984 [Serendipita vermifera MAFF 305830]|uniref:Nephrocystin 3-like N-terminal domain-containing protein n=1 Tax=Serendipita vermifera MAFF 305830 TaxID=933852 RepID=A0A0C2WYJ0_SERVB|nr:hypothetical protein M408DRAFT_290984 [Serendipita vermifera MAFF 305830]
MLKFHVATVENQITKLEEDVEVDLPAPSANNLAQPIEAYYSVTMKLANVQGDMARVTQIIPDMESTFERYTTALHRSVEELASHTLLQSQPELPQEAGKVNINPNSNAYGNQHVPCLPGTRKKTLSAIHHWVDDNNSGNRMFCLLDVAGSGKSTVAKTMADEWKAENRLVARFFFSRDTAETMSTKSFCSTVANAFAARNPTFEASMKRYMKIPDWQLLPLEEQFEGLVTGPLRKCQQPAILMIDALDECGKEHGVRRTLLETLCSQFHSVPSLRIFVTSRPEPDIKGWVMQEMRVRYTNFVQLEGGSGDVEIYIRSRLQGLPNVQDRLYPVIRYADGLFIWARIACDLLLNAVDAECLLETLGKEVSLDYLYKVALKESMPEDRSSQARMITVFQMILAAKEPLSIVELDRLSPKRGIVEPVVTRLSSLLLHQNREDPIRLLHATLREFLTAQQQAGEYYIQSGLGHYTLALGCIGVVSHQAAQDLDNLTKLDQVSARKDIRDLKGYALITYSGSFTIPQRHGYITVLNHAGS